jgi:uncharacterized protein with FMN-binding domain
MKRAVVIILAVAIIGALGLAAKGNSENMAAPAASSSATQTLASNTSEQVPAATSDSSASAGSYKDGTYSGESENTLYGTVQVAAVVSGGKITDIQFLQMPGPEGNSRQITSFAEPLLRQETIQSQSAHIDFVSGATQTSEAYEMSLQAALDQAAMS